MMVEAAQLISVWAAIVAFAFTICIDQYGWRHKAYRFLRRNGISVCQIERVISWYWWSCYQINGLGLIVTSLSLGGFISEGIAPYSALGMCANGAIASKICGPFRGQSFANRGRVAQHG